MQPYPARSEVWVAVTEGASVYSFGELWPPMSGSSMKTKMEVSLIAADFAELAEQWCGEPDYWRFPEFRGKKTAEGQWESPFTNAFRTENKGTFLEPYMWLALADFISGMDQLDGSGYGKLSEEQVVTGVPNSFIKAANLRTSVGPPYNQGKRHHVARIEQEVYFSPQLCEIYDDLKQQLEEGHIPSALGLCTLKDEPLKPGKKPRVFTVYPAAYNFLLKEYMAGIKNFMRANYTFFESAVGIDMTSHLAMGFIVFLSTVDPNLSNGRDGDVTGLDKSFRGTLYDFIALFFYSVAFKVGISPFKVMSLVLGLKHTKFCIKGDIFSVWWNGSGNDITVEVNGVLMCLSHRYYWFFKKYPTIPQDLLDHIAAWRETFFTNPFPSPAFCQFLDFRLHNALMTYGDDVARFLDYDEEDDFVQVMHDHIGLIITDANKGTTLERKSILEMGFLKRTFVWSEEFQRYITPLSKKSLARMLMIKRESTLSSRDHAAVNMTNVMREMVYHGIHEYEHFAAKALEVATKHELTTNPNFNFRPYDYWAQKIKDQTFSTWEA